jgi:hypothetical protein
LLHKFGTVVVPIVLYGDNSRKPLEDRWTRYSVDFAGRTPTRKGRGSFLRCGLWRLDWESSSRGNWIVD